jgi:hypothetical protein
MFAGMLAYTRLAPTEYEGEPYLALTLSAEMTSLTGLVAALWVIAYLAWTLWRSHSERRTIWPEHEGAWVHPGERWVVLAHAVAFGSGYALGASNASFLLVLAVHHEVQYLYFTYAMARRLGDFGVVRKRAIDAAKKDLDSKGSCNSGRLPQTGLKSAASFLLWPVVGFAGAMVGGWSGLQWLAPLGTGGLFCHYWLDGRIWTRRSFRD